MANAMRNTLALAVRQTLANVTPEHDSDGRRYKTMLFYTPMAKSINHVCFAIQMSNAIKTMVFLLVPMQHALKSMVFI